MTSCIQIIKGSLFLGLRSLFFWDLCFCCNHRNVPFPSENQISYHNLFVCHLHLHQFLMIASLTPFRFFIVLHHYTSGCFLKVSADTILSSLSEWISKKFSHTTGSASILYLHMKKLCSIIQIWNQFFYFINNQSGASG